LAVPKAPRRRIVEFPRRRRRRAEKMNPHGAEGAAPKKSTLAAPKAPRRKITKMSNFISPLLQTQ
jgi:hypothetical protein